TSDLPNLPCGSAAPVSGITGLQRPAHEGHAGAVDKQADTRAPARTPGPGPTSLSFAPCCTTGRGGWLAWGSVGSPRLPPGATDARHTRRVDRLSTARGPRR